jgi:hypothetical protein
MVRLGVFALFFSLMSNSIALADDSESAAQAPEHFSNQLLVEFGALPNHDAYGLYGTELLPVLGVRYARELAYHFLINNAPVSDALFAEIGLYGYRIEAVVDTTKYGYPIVPIVLNLRYDLRTSQKFAVFLFAGVLKNIVVPVGKQNDTAKGFLSSTFPNAGAGVSYYDLSLSVGLASFLLKFAFPF